MVTGAEERTDNESYKFSGTQPDKIFVKTGLADSSGNPIDPSNPLPITSVSHTATDLEGNGKISVSLTAVEVIFTGITESIIITADIDNSGKIFVGKSNVTSDGSNAITFLERGDSVTIDYDDATNPIYVVSDTASQNFWQGATL